VKSAGAVGIENINIWNFNNLEEMLGNAKALKRNNREYKKILIGLLMAPHFSGAEIPFSVFFFPSRRVLASVSGQIFRHGWQTEDSTVRWVNVNSWSCLSVPRRSPQQNKTNELARWV
jgi:hypothetical protein